MNRRVACIALGVAVGFLVVGLGAAEALATAVSHSAAVITWPMSFSDNITWTFGSRYSESGADAADDLGTDGHDDKQLGWVNTSITATVTTANGYAETTGARLYEEVRATRDGITTNASHAGASASRWGRFVVNASGWVTVTSAYVVFQELSTTLSGEEATGASSAWVRVMGPGGQDIDEQNMLNTVKDGQVLPQQQRTGELSVSLWFYAGDQGYFDSYVTNIADVIPEPTSMGLLVLGGLALLRRRRTA